MPQFGRNGGTYVEMTPTPGWGRRRTPGGRRVPAASDEPPEPFEELFDFDFVDELLDFFEAPVDAVDELLDPVAELLLDPVVELLLDPVLDFVEELLCAWLGAAANSANANSGTVKIAWRCIGFLDLAALTRWQGIALSTRDSLAIPFATARREVAVPIADWAGTPPSHKGRDAGRWANRRPQFPRPQPSR
jgi:hypothetical protein